MDTRQKKPRCYSCQPAFPQLHSSYFLLMVHDRCFVGSKETTLHPPDKAPLSGHTVNPQRMRVLVSTPPSAAFVPGSVVHMTTSLLRNLALQQVHDFSGTRVQMPLHILLS